MTGFPDRLASEFCRDIAISPVDGVDQKWQVRTPFLFDDGDAVPVFAIQHERGWTLTDDGQTMSHMFFDGFTLTKGRRSRIERIVDEYDAQLEPETLKIRFDLPEEPGSQDLADFLRLTGQVNSVALESPPKTEAKRYQTQICDYLSSVLIGADWELGWRPKSVADQTKSDYRADMRIKASTQMVALFTAGTTERAARAAHSASMFVRFVEGAVHPVLLYSPKVTSSSTLYRFEDEGGSIYRADPGNLQSIRSAMTSESVELGTG